MKKIFDAVHGFIRFDEIETQLIRTPAFQRLQAIHQLGIAFYIYPGGTHKRYEHSIGVMELASRMYDQVVTAFDQRSEVPYVPEVDSSEFAYWRKVLRFAALCHDLGHLPFSHVAEGPLLGKGGHEIWTVKIIRSEVLRPIWEAFATQFQRDASEVTEHIVKIAVGEEKSQQSFSPWEKVLTEIITGDFFGADRMDYLLRDARCTGLPYGSFDYHQLIEMLRIFPGEKGDCIIGVEENGLESCESLLMARSFMQRRIYQYATARSYIFHLSRFMELTYRDKTLFEDIHRYLKFTDHHVFVELSNAEEDPSHPGHLDALAIADRNERFRAISFTGPSDESSLLALKQEIPKNKFSYLLFPSAVKHVGLSFPVLCPKGHVVRGDQLSQLVIPFSSKNWAFVHPSYEEAVRKSLICYDGSST